MFQIKTDIRQYKCETREKVERLIRNWVIRPSDLIYNDDDGEWNPIGQHPSFDSLFRELEEEESRVPDTVVTSDRPGDDDGERGEVTQLTESPLEQEDEDDPPQPPEPSEDVEGLVRDSDEITMMTDKTLDMMRLEDSSAEDASGDEETTNVVERDEVDEDEDEESTNVVEREDLVEPGDETDAAGDDEASKDKDTDVVERDEVYEEDEDTDVVDRDDVDGAPADDESSAQAEDEPEATNVIERDEVQDEAPEEEAEATEEPQGAGRHGLPEDVFVTNEIPSQSAQDGVLDELGELAEDDEDFDLDEGLSDSSDAVVEEPEKTPVDRPESGERRAKWRIVMSEDEEDEGDVDDEWENVADDMRATDELSADDLDKKITEDRKAPQETLDFDEEVEEDADDEESLAADASDADLEEAELEEVEVEAVEDDGDDDLDGLLDDAAELVGVRRDPDAAQDSGGREPVETPVGDMENPAFVSEGYHMDLPIDVGPSEEDLAMGVPRANVSEETKEATFPYPKPKYPGKVIIRTFGLGEELADDDDMADDLPEPDDGIDPTAETKPLLDDQDEKTQPISESEPESKPEPAAKPAAEATMDSSKSVPNPSTRRKPVEEPPKDQSALIVIFLLGTFIIALILAVYFLG